MKSAFISGASHGIGKAIAYELAKNGYHLALNCMHSRNELENLCRRLQEDYKIDALPLIGDIGDYETVCELFSAKARFGSIDLLVNNAGISYIGLLSEMSADEWQKIINTNLSSVFFCCQQAVPDMVRNKSGRILNISSVWGEVGASCEQLTLPQRAA